MKTASPLLALLIRFQDSLTSRDFIIDYFVEAELMSKEDAIRTSMIRPGKLYVDGDKTYVVTEATSPKVIRASEVISLPENYKLGFYDRITLSAGMIENYDGPDVETTLGVFLLNKVVLAKPFGAAVPYVNGHWSIGKVEAEITKRVIDGIITPAQVFKYIDNVYSVGSLNDFCVPSLTEKSITSRPEVTKRRDELLEQYKDQLNDPNIMIKIEDELIALDRKLLEGDESSGFLISGKNFDVQRKRMFIMLGLIESFGDDIKTFNFGKENLNTGWDTDEMDVLANDIRRGSFDRAKATALGGAESKMLGRNFQDSAIIADDCGTTRGLRIRLTERNKKFFVNRNIVVGSSVEELTDNTINSYLGKDVTVRSPMFCATHDGYCYTCMDTRFKRIGIKLLNIQPVSIGSTILTMSLKAMHGSKTALLEIDDINQFLI